MKEVDALEDDHQVTWLFLQSSSRWPETTVIVMGDHCWRLGPWERQDGWTREDEQAAPRSL